jgi:hypothetical protein
MAGVTPSIHGNIGGRKGNKTVFRGTRATVYRSLHIRSPCRWFPAAFPGRTVRIACPYIWLTLIRAAFQSTREYVEFTPYRSSHRGGFFLLASVIGELGWLKR